MARGINIEFVANVDKLLGRTRDVESALDDVADSLDDLAREGEKAGDKAGDGLKDGLDDAGDAAKKLERKFKDAYDEVKKGSRKAGDDLGDNIKRGADRASDGLDDVKDEAKDSAREVASNFDGSMDGVVGGVQELAANLGGLGPIGAAAGLAAAAGAGYFYEEWKKKQEQARELMTSFFEDMLASGAAFASEDLIRSNISAILTDDEGAVVKYAEAQEQAQRAGVDLSVVLRAYAGDQDAANQAADAARARLAELGDDAGGTSVVLQGLIQGVTGVGSAAQEAAGRVEVGREAMRTTAEATNAWSQAQASVVDIIGETNTALVENGKTYAGNAEVLREKNVAALNEMASRLAEVNQAAVDANVTGADLAAVQREQYDAFMAAASGAGMARDDAEKLAETYNLVPTAVETEVSTPGATAAQTDVQNLKSAMDLLEPVDVKVNVITPAKAELARRMRELALQVNVPVQVGVSRAGMIVQ